MKFAQQTSLFFLKLYMLKHTLICDMVCKFQVLMLNLRQVKES